MQLHRFINHTGVQLVLGFILLLAGTSFVIADSRKNLHIVTDIAPIHSLVSMVIGQQAEVSLLVPPGQSPHSFNLKPSQRRTIHNASLIIILSDSFTPSLSKHLKAIDESHVLQLSDTNGTPERIHHNGLAHINNKHETDEHNEDKKNDNDDSLSSSALEHLHDPHAWLNPENAIAWLDVIAEAVIELDTENKVLYLSNAKQAKADLSAMHNDFTLRLSAVKSVPYIVYHDAYQHFAQTYGLQKPIAIALSDARAPGARKLRAMRALASHSKCVFSEVLHDDIIVDTVTDGLPVKRAILDPIGSTIPIGPNQYPQLMSALVDNFISCLN